MGEIGLQKQGLAVDATVTSACPHRSKPPLTGNIQLGPWMTGHNRTQLSDIGRFCSSTGSLASRYVVHWKKANSLEIFSSEQVLPGTLVNDDPGHELGS